MAYHCPDNPINNKIVIGGEYAHSRWRGLYYILIAHYPITGYCKVRYGHADWIMWISEGELLSRYVYRPGGYHDKPV